MSTKTPHNFVIEKNVPPSTAHGEYSQTLRKMEVGDSMEVSREEAQSFLRAARLIGYTITTRKQIKGGTRVWLIKKKPKKYRCRERNFVMDYKD